MSIISLSGKIGSGKDTAGKIIQIITDNPHFTNKTVETWLSREILNPKWEVKKFADTLKDIICLLIGCSREQLEDQEFKEKELGEEWTRYGYADGFSHNYFYRNGEETKTTIMNAVPCSKEKYEQERITNWQTAYKSVLTPRLLLQLLGTECGRNIIHPNIWVNSLMSKYKAKGSDNNGFVTNVNPEGMTLTWQPMILTEPNMFPNWIITDTRFPNELKAVKDKGGISIRVNREIKHQVESLGGTTDVPKGHQLANQHESETALDNATFDYTINNDGTIEELILKVKEILVHAKILSL